MKKFLFLPLVVMVCVMFGGCTAEMESEPSTKAEKVDEVRLKILEMAEDYGLNVKVNDKQLAQNVDYINIDSLERVMKALTRIKGTYKLKASNDNNSSKVVRQQRKTMRSNRSTSHTYRYEFDEESIRKEDLYFTCNCILTWDLTLDEKTGRESFNNISVRCFIECNEDILGDCIEHVSATARSDNSGIIDISGYVSYEFNPSLDWREEHGYGMSGTVCIEFKVSGCYGGDDSSISWS